MNRFKGQHKLADILHQISFALRNELEANKVTLPQARISAMVAEIRKVAIDPLREEIMAYRVMIDALELSGEKLRDLIKLAQLGSPNRSKLEAEDEE